jgi:hypothetical protein
MPDIIDFCVTKGLNTKKFLVETRLDPTSDHTPIIVTMYAQVIDLNMIGVHPASVLKMLVIL